MDDGVFKIRTFGEKTRSIEEIEMEELNINEAIGINDYTMPITNFPDPYITCVFVTDEIIFVNLFHNKDLCHHHFFYDRVNRQVRDHVKFEMAFSNRKNFPYKCFYSEEENEVFSFYR